MLCSFYPTFSLLIHHDVIDLVMIIPTSRFSGPASVFFDLFEKGVGYAKPICSTEINQPITSIVSLSITELAHHFRGASFLFPLWRLGLPS